TCPRTRSVARSRVDVLAVAVATVAVTLGAYVLVQKLGPDPGTGPGGRPVPTTTSAPSATPTPSPSGSVSGRCATDGWKARTVPPGYQPSDPQQMRQDGWQAGWETRDGIRSVVLRV